VTTISQTGVTDLLVHWSEGDQEALNKLIPLVYDELHKLASRYLRRERRDHTLQTTAVVHEAYLKLVNQRDANFENRLHFFAVAAQIMRRILVDYARRHHASKRGGDLYKLSLDEALVTSEEKGADLLALDEALERLAAIDPRQSRVVELRVFAGLTLEETAQALNISPSTVRREWSTAKAWLHRQITKRPSMAGN
jgi:RNA polymerase sigma factor (TIGR02999 family)